MTGKIVTIFGSPSNPGVCSIISTLSQSEHRVRLAVANDDTSSLNDVSTVRVSPDRQEDFYSALEGSNICIVFTETDFQCPHQEVDYGKQIALACKAACIEHVVLSTQISVLKVLGIAAQHMDNKAAIESEMLRLGLPLTCVIVPLYYDQLLQPPLLPHADYNGNIYLDIPMGEVPLDMISSSDMGPIIQAIIGQTPAPPPQPTQRPAIHAHKTHSISACKLTLREIAACTSTVLGRGANIIAKQITLDQFRAKRVVGIADYAAMFDFYKRVDQQTSIANTKELYPHIQTLQQWLHTHAQRVRDVCSNLAVH